MIVGGGIIGLEMASIYHALGSSISIVEMTDQLIPPADADLVRPLQKKLKKIAEGIYTSTKVTGVESGKKKLALYLDGKKAPEKIEGDAVLIAVGRRANSGNLGLEKAGIEADERGIIPVNARQQTNVPNIYAVGDVTGGPMLAHRGSYQGKIAAEAAAGRASAYSVMSVPSIAYTHPEVAWVGLTEKEAKQQGISYQKGVFPWQASGRALSSDATDGMTKVLFDEESGRLIGAGITGLNAGELLAEAVLALEMGSTAEDIALTMHAHPTLSETFGLAAEIVDGSITEMMNKK
jgi:dihydrolipoamide dehydrogenase